MSKIITFSILFTLSWAETDFTIAFIPDTQYWVNSSRHDRFNKINEWLVQHKDSLKLVFVNHVGDVVDRPDDNTGWSYGQEAMDILESSDVPHAIAPGNHDGVGEYPEFNQRFPLSRFEDKEWYAGSFPQGKSTNTYYKISAAGVPLLLVSLAYDPDNNELNWADGVIKANPDRKVIITTHSYMGSAWNGNAGERNRIGNGVWNSIVKNNPNVIMVACGHETGAGWRVDNNDAGNPVYQVLTDWQFWRDMSPSNQNYWEGMFRFHQFDLATNEMHTITYNPYENESYTHQDGKHTVKNLLGEYVPVRAFKKIKHTHPGNNKQVLYYNFLGKQVKTIKTQTNELNMMLHTGSIYLIQFKDGGNKIVFGEHIIK